MHDLCQCWLELTGHTELTDDGLSQILAVLPKSLMRLKTFNCNMGDKPCETLAEHNLPELEELAIQNNRHLSPIVDFISRVVRPLLSMLCFSGTSTNHDVSRKLIADWKSSGKDRKPWIPSSCWKWMDVHETG